MANDEYHAAILKIVNEVDQLVTNNPAVREVFTGHIDQLCKLAEDYGQAQQPYSKQLEKAQKRKQKLTPKQVEKYKLPDGTIAVPLVDICPPPKGYVKMSQYDNPCINVPQCTIYRPAKPANPLLWFGIFGGASIHHKPTEDEKLMCDYVLMAVIHDYELGYSGTPTDNHIFSADYKGKWFEWESFCKAAGGYYHPYPIPGITYCSATGQEKLSQLNRVLDHVKADIKTQPTEAGEGNETTDVGSLSDIVPELAVYDNIPKNRSHLIFLLNAMVTARYSKDRSLPKKTKEKIKALFLAKYTLATIDMRDFLLGMADLSRDERNYRQRQLEELYGKAKDLLFESLDNNMSNLKRFNELLSDELIINGGLAFDADSYLGRGIIDKKTRAVKHPKSAGAEHNQQKGKASEKPEQENTPRHSPDFRSVKWFGTDFSFTAPQAAAIEILWEAWENNTPDVGGDTLANLIGSESKRARDIFKGNLAFGTMIVRGETKGSYRLVEPNKNC